MFNRHRAVPNFYSILLKLMPLDIVVTILQYLDSFYGIGYDYMVNKFN